MDRNTVSEDERTHLTLNHLSGILLFNQQNLRDLITALDINGCDKDSYHQSYIYHCVLLVKKMY